MEPDATPIDAFAEYQLCQSIITHLQVKKNASVHAINRALKIPDSKMIIRRKRFQDYFIRLDHNRFSLNDDILQPMNYKLPLHPAAIPIQAPVTPEEAQKHMIQYQDHTEFPMIQYLNPSIIDPSTLLTERWVALDLEGFNTDTTNYSLAQISINSTKALLFDRQLGGEAIHHLLQQVLCQSSTIEYICLHDLTCDVQALSSEFLENITSSSFTSSIPSLPASTTTSSSASASLLSTSKAFLDTQLMYEYFTHELYGGFNRILSYFDPSDLLTHQSKTDIGNRMKRNERYWFTRDLTAEQIHYAAKDVLLLHHAFSYILTKVIETSQTQQLDLLQVWLLATKKRIHYSLISKQRYIVFHQQDYYPMTLELVEALAEVNTPNNTIYQQIVREYMSPPTEIEVIQLIPDLLYATENQSKHLLVLSQRREDQIRLLQQMARALSVANKDVVVVTKLSSTSTSTSTPDNHLYGTAQVLEVPSDRRQAEVIQDLLSSGSHLPAVIILLDLIDREEDLAVIKACQHKQIRVIAGYTSSFIDLLQVDCQWNQVFGGLSETSTSPNRPPNTSTSTTTTTSPPLGNKMNRPLLRRENHSLFDIAIEIPATIPLSCRIFRDCARTVDLYLQWGRGKGEMRIGEINEMEGRWKICHHFIEIERE